MYMHHTRAETITPFSVDYPNNGDPDYETSVSEASVNDTIDLVHQTLKEVLEAFRGIEVFYEVYVKSMPETGDEAGKEKGNDTRVIEGIKMIDNDKYGINCFMIDPVKSNIIYQNKELQDG